MRLLLICIRFLIVATLLTGVAYPLAMTGIAKELFPRQAEGSLVKRGEEVLGSELIAQKFEAPKYFWSRPSGIDFNPQPSSGTNLGPTSADLKTKVEERRKAMLDSLTSAGNSGEVPQSLLFASASGVDPELSPEAVRFQMPRIVNTRQLDAAQQADLQTLIQEMTEARQWGILGEPRINVLKLNLAMDLRFPEQK